MVSAVPSLPILTKVCATCGGKSERAKLAFLVEVRNAVPPVELPSGRKSIGNTRAALSVGVAPVAICTVVLALKTITPGGIAVAWICSNPAGVP
jgi:hypothetical protein